MELSGSDVFGNEERSGLLCKANSITGAAETSGFAGSKPFDHPVRCEGLQLEGGRM
jgi:hypothetical protein